MGYEPRLKVYIWVTNLDSRFVFWVSAFFWGGYKPRLEVCILGECFFFFPPFALLGVVSGFGCWSSSLCSSPFPLGIGAFFSFYLWFDLFSR